jgi:murein DD-endopeptidase MepM/ murein hydrolase activator NlpD
MAARPSPYELERQHNARIIISVGRQLGASSRDILIALMAALQESGLRNLSYGDRDSVGLFQQRAGWGSYAQRMNPATSARMFFLGGLRGPGTPGLLDNRRRNSMSLTAAAQWVQRSAFPRAYAKHENRARSLMGLAGSGGGVGGRSTNQPTGGWVRPISGGRMTQEFGRKNPWYGAGYHTGMDFSGGDGRIYAAATGRVVKVTSGGRYGKRIEIEHGGKLWTLYAHLSSANVRVGQHVSAGQFIGMMGNTGGTGRGMGKHLHFEVRKGANRYGNTVNPAPYLNGRSTPTAYMDPSGATTTTVPAEIPTDPMAMIAQQVTRAAPYVYINPMDLYSGTQMPGAEDPLSQYGPVSPLPASVAEEKTPTEVNPLELEGALSG